MNEEDLPFSIRDGRRTIDIPETGFPPALKSSIYEWLHTHFFRSGITDETPAPVFALEAQIKDFGRDDYYSLWSYVVECDNYLIDFIETITRKFADQGLSYTIKSLNKLFDYCGHELEINVRDGKFLYRVPPAEKYLFEKVTSPEDRASELLKKAWTTSYAARKENRDPSTCWRSCIQALECLYAPIVTPNDKEPSIGKIVKALEQGKHKFSFLLDEVKSGVKTEDEGLNFVISGLKQVHYEPGRHGDGEPPTEAQAATVLSISIGLAAISRLRAILRHVNS